ncbi:MAG TPA: dihydrolipoamide acetyltransferase family protein [Paludibacter sp.]|nr:dihydrolipoamide acetyltransferase family protein [Paludibacter sp.]HOS45022.1 dihydrolipoamide acetyltransferase family protein [Paludibacter sp.]HPM08983.1 dihydrolipoamide acetyltransferase family protein [Paludibacter sp.]
MATLIIMPKQGQSVESCIIGSIKKKGDVVKKGDILFSYETDKASFEEESPVDGTVLEVFYGEGDEVPVLDKMMIIGEPGEDYRELLQEGLLEQGTKNKEQRIESEELSTENKEQGTKTKDLKSPLGDLGGSQVPPGEFRDPEKTTQKVPLGGFRGLSPRARQLASKEALDTSSLAGSGPGGRIIERDVKAALGNRPKMTPLAKKIAASENMEPQGGSGLAGMARSVDLVSSTNAVYPADFEDRKVTHMRKLIARAMHTSLQNSAQLTHHLGADARRILELRKQVKAANESGRLSANITLNDMVCFAVIKALKKFPNVNTHFLGDTIRYFNKVHLAVAVDTERGLMVPVIKNADDLSIVELSNQIKELANTCRTGSVNPDILSAEAGTFTVSNLGNYGVEMFTPVINLPQSAILGVNTIVPRPKDLGDGVYAFVPYIGLSLTYDHRALDGGEATQFLKQIAIEIETMESPLAH